jgi:hypothetical protein
MRIYYTSKPVLFFMCAGNEAFYAALYLLHFTEGPIGMFIIARMVILSSLLWAYGTYNRICLCVPPNEPIGQTFTKFHIIIMPM